MLCFSIKLIIKQSMHAVLELPVLIIDSKAKTLVQSQKCMEPHALQNLACSSLCQLSESICREDASANKRMDMFQHYDHNNCSPWRLRKEEIALEAEVAMIKKNINMKAKLIRYNSILTTQQPRENFTQIKKTKENKQEAQIQKYPSIFMKLRAAKEAKNELAKKEKSQTEIITIMRKRKSTNREELDSKKIALAEQIEDHANNLRLFHKKIEDLELIKKHSLNIIKQVPSCLIELEGDSIDKQCNKSNKGNMDHWKSRKTSVKPKKGKKSQCKEGKSIDRKDNKENIPLAKKTSFSLERPYKQEYQSSNPLTRLLYQKYINTINIHQPKEQYFHFI